MPGAGTKESKYCFDSSGQCTSTYGGFTTLLHDEEDYHYGPGSTPGSLLRRTVTTYQQFPPKGTIENMPCSVIVYSSGTSKLAETDYLYDGALYSGGSGVCGAPPTSNQTASASGLTATTHDATYGTTSSNSRGNATQKYEKCLYNCSSDSIYQYGYDEAGQLVSWTDADNHSPTSVSYMCSTPSLT